MSAAGLLIQQKRRTPRTPVTSLTSNINEGESVSGPWDWWMFTLSPPPVHLCLSARCGGTVGAILTCPLEVVKTRLQSSSITFYMSQVQLSTVNSASVARVAPPGPLHCLKWVFAVIFSRNQLPYAKTEQFRGELNIFLLNYSIIIKIIIMSLEIRVRVDEHLSSLTHCPSTFWNTNESYPCQVNPTIFHTSAEFLSPCLCGHSSCLLISRDEKFGFPE